MDPRELERDISDCSHSL